MNKIVEKKLKELQLEIQQKNYTIKHSWGIVFTDLRVINFSNIKIPKNTLLCRNCQKIHKNGLLKPVLFVMKDRKYIEPYNIFVVCKCSTCNETVVIRYHEYLEQTTPIEKEIKKDRSERNLEIIQTVYKCTREEAIKINKEEEEKSIQLNKQLEQERMERLYNYEEEDRLQKSLEKKALIQSGELLYDKRNRVFYYKSTGKVYESLK